MAGRRLMIATMAATVFLLTAPAEAAGSLKIQRMTDLTGAQGAGFTCVYPRFSGICDVQSQQRLNVLVKERATCQKQRTEYAARCSPGVSGSFDYEIKRNEDGVMSLVLNRSLRQGTHTEQDRQGLTVETVSGKICRLDDLFFDDADYSGILKDEVEKQISRRKLDSRLLHEIRQIRPNENYYMTRDTLVIVFGEGSCFSSDCGIQEFPIPLKSLDGSLRPVFRPGT